tara:strand:+ start:331 stop:564 length:234 start_codon:yes stop_codon:yes gene_type:complete
MSISKKHFNNIAKILNDNWNREKACFNDNIVVDLGAYFQSENKNFNSTKWVDACYKKKVSIKNGVLGDDWKHRKGAQ